MACQTRAGGVGWSLVRNPPGRSREQGASSMTHRYRWGSAAAVASLIVGGLALTAAPQAAQAADWSGCLDGSSDRQAVFARASDVSGVPEKVLLGVSYMESRW